jgi:hypothetical protein
VKTPAQIWQALGGSGSPPAALGRSRGPLLILGGGATVWEDFGRVRPWGGEIMAVNDVGAYVHEPIRHWVTLHPEFMPGWRYFRRKHLYGAGYSLTCHAPKPGVEIDQVWHIENRGGSSGLFGCFVGLMLGYDPIVLAGVPMDNSRHFFDPPWYGHELGDRANEIVWREARDLIFEGRVRSLSGRTMHWLGAPQMKVKAAA